MSTDEIKRFLKEHKGVKFSANQLSVYIGLNIYSVYTNLRKLRKDLGKQLKKKPYLVYYFDGKKFNCELVE